MLPYIVRRLLEAIPVVELTCGWTDQWGQVMPTAGNYQGKEYVDLIERMNATASPVALKTLYRQKNELLLDECFELPIASSKRPLVAVSKVHGFQYARNGGFRMVNTWKEK